MFQAVNEGVVNWQDFVEVNTIFMPEMWRSFNDLFVMSN